MRSLGIFCQKKTDDYRKFLFAEKLGMNSKLVYCPVSTSSESLRRLKSLQMHEVFLATKNTFQCTKLWPFHVRMLSEIRLEHSILVSQNCSIISVVQLFYSKYQKRKHFQNHAGFDLRCNQKFTGNKHFSFFLRQFLAK